MKSIGCYKEEEIGGDTTYKKVQNQCRTSTILPFKPSPLLPWNHEDDIISVYTTYHDSYMSKQDIIHQNAKKINEDCVSFDVDLQDLENNVLQSALDMVAPHIAQDDRTANVEGFYTLQNEQQEKEDTIDAVSHDDTRNTRDTLSMLYAKAAKGQDMNIQDYCRHVHNLNTDQHHIVMYNIAWFKSYINAVRHGENQKGYRIFLSGPGGTGKSHLPSHITLPTIYEKHL